MRLWYKQRETVVQTNEDCENVAVMGKGAKTTGKLVSLAKDFLTGQIIWIPNRVISLN